MSKWIENLALAVDKSSQRVVGSKIGYSPATISLVLKGTYKGDLSAVERAVKSKLNTAALECPVLGQITPTQCSNNQNKPFSANSSMHVRLFKACRACPNNTKRKDQ